MKRFCLRNHFDYVAVTFYSQSEKITTSKSDLDIFNERVLSFFMNASFPSTHFPLVAHPLAIQLVQYQIYTNTVIFRVCRDFWCHSTGDNMLWIIWWVFILSWMGLTCRCMFWGRESHNQISTCKSSYLILSFDLKVFPGFGMKLQKQSCLKLSFRNNFSLLCLTYHFVVRNQSPGLENLMQGRVHVFHTLKGIVKV